LARSHQRDSIQRKLSVATLHLHLLSQLQNNQKENKQLTMTENTKDYDAKTLQEPLIAEDVQPEVLDNERASPLESPTSDALASKHQVRGAAWAGGISGLLVGGPLGALLLGWGAVHLAKKNAGDAGNFCRKSGDFMCRMGRSIRHG
jgi:hypothetical protein